MGSSGCITDPCCGMSAALPIFMHPVRASEIFLSITTFLFVYTMVFAAKHDGSFNIGSSPAKDFMCASKMFIPVETPQYPYFPGNAD